MPDILQIDASVQIFTNVVVGISLQVAWDEEGADNYLNGRQQGEGYVLPCRVRGTTKEVILQYIGTVN